MEYIKVTNSDNEAAIINKDMIAYIEDLSGSSLIILTNGLGSFKVKESIESLLEELGE